jgi:predicted ribosome-associated RNA-binding protein Tma20
MLNALLAITNRANQKVEFPSHIQAALINPRIMQVLNKPVITKPSVYNLMDFNAHPLSESTILDNGAATHLVNSSNCLVPGTF